jgi:hypothetical protein
VKEEGGKVEHHQIGRVRLVGCLYFQLVCEVGTSFFEIHTSKNVDCPIQLSPGHASHLMIGTQMHGSHGSYVQSVRHCFGILVAGSTGCKSVQAQPEQMASRGI